MPRARRLLVITGIGLVLIASEVVSFYALNRWSEGFARSMETLVQKLGVAIDIVSAASKKQQKKTAERRYAAPDGGLLVVVVPVGKEPGRPESESRIEFTSSDGRISCGIDYSSDDSEHGFGVVKAEWTTDSQYFVFSLTSSGGHQPWHAPTQFLSRRDGTVRTLDDYFGAAGISTADFRLVAPNTVKTVVWEGKSVPVSVRLAVLPPLRSWRKTKPFLINCVGGHVFRP